MIVYVKDTQFPIEANVNPYNAALGFYLRGEEVIHYREQKEIGTFTKDDILVDYVTETQAFLAAMGIQVPHFDYPTALQPYIGRNVHQAKLEDIINNPSSWGVFIKPVSTTKWFTGRVINQAQDLRGIGMADDTRVWGSDAVEFVAEWRAYILDGTVIDVRPYAGDYHFSFDATVLDTAVTAWTDAPAAYSLDIGAAQDGKTLIVEVNDGYALGSYGLSPYKYAAFLQARWQQLVAPFFAENDVFVVPDSL